MDPSLIEKIDFYNEFEDWYFKILKDFNYDNQKDIKARDFLQQIIMQKPKGWNLENVLKSIDTLIKEKDIILIYGCGPSLEETVEYILGIKENKVFNNFLNFTADGSSRFLREKGIPVDIIFTDLDGITKEEFYYSKYNVIHAHGDNLDKLHEFQNDIIKYENIIGTTQVKPIENIINHGGFTDGDRILYFLRTFLTSKHKIYLIGMDFNDKVGKYSKLGMIESIKTTQTKKKKLKYAIKLIESIIAQLNANIYFVNSKIESKNFMNISLEDFRNSVLV